MERTKGKKINAFSMLAAGLHITLDSCPRVSKILLLFLISSQREETVRG